MIRPGGVVTYRNRRVRAHKNRSGMLYLVQRDERVRRQDLKMLRGIFIGEIDGLFHVPGNKDIGVLGDRCLDDLLAGQGFELLIYQTADLVGQLLRIRYQDGRRIGIMFDLRQEIDGNELRIAGFVGQNESLARPRGKGRSRLASVTGAKRYTTGAYKYDERPIIQLVSMGTSDTAAAVAGSGDMRGEVKIRFKSETFPIEKMLDSDQMLRVQGSGRGTPSATVASTVPQEA